MTLLFPEAQSRPAEPTPGKPGRPGLEAGAEFMIRCNERIAEEVRTYCLENDVSQRSFFEEAAARLLFAEKQRKAKRG